MTDTNGFKVTRLPRGRVDEHEDFCPDLKHYPSARGWQGKKSKKEKQEELMAKERKILAEPLEEGDETEDK